MRGCWACLVTITLARGLRDKSYNATEHSNFLFSSLSGIFDRRLFSAGPNKEPNVECRSNAIEHDFFQNISSSAKRGGGDFKAHHLHNLSFSIPHYLSNEPLDNPLNYFSQTCSPKESGINLIRCGYMLGKGHDFGENTWTPCIPACTEIYELCARPSDNSFMGREPRYVDRH